MSAAIPYPIRSPRWALNYSGVDLTADISRMVVAITYGDYLSGLASEAEIEVEDRDRRWQGPWYPALGDQLSLAIGYAGEKLLPCGDFEVDEIELSGPPDTLRLRCLSAYITPALRTRNSIGYENQSLMQIAATVAGKYGLTVVEAPSNPGPIFERVTQNQESDLAFLKRIANENGYDFTVRGSQLIFYTRSALEAAAPVYTIDRTQTIEFSFINRTRLIYQGAEVSYLNPYLKELVSQSASASGVPTGDRLKLVARCENGQQAALKAGAALHLHNMLYLRVAATLPGTTVLVAGNVVSLTGFGAMDGAYLIEAARHRLERRLGYQTAIEARRVSA